MLHFIISYFYIIFYVYARISIPFRLLYRSSEIFYTYNFSTKNADSLLFMKITSKLSTFITVNLFGTQAPGLRKTSLKKCYSLENLEAS